MEELFNFKNVILIGFITGLVSNFKSIAGWMWRVISMRLFTQIEVNNGTVNYEYILRWLSDNHASKFSSFVSVQKNGWGSNQDGFLGLGFGEFIFLHNRIPIWISHSKKDFTGGGSQTLAIQTLSIKSLKSAKPIILDIIESARRVYKYDGIAVHLLHYSDWNFGSTKQDRTFENVILPEKDEARIKSALDNFIKSKERYKSIGIPYRMGIMLHGIQGSGKTSTVYAIASYLGYPIYYLTLNGSKDAEIIKAVGGVPKKSILLIEDIHDQLANIKTSNDLNIATLLNIFDGIGSPEEIITIITTNDHTQLDPRLLRPGRINLSIEYSYATEEQQEKLFALFGKRIEVQGEKTIAQLQQDILSGF